MNVAILNCKGVIIMSQTNHNNMKLKEYKKTMAIKSSVTHANEEKHEMSKDYYPEILGHIGVKLLVNYHEMKDDDKIKLDQFLENKGSFVIKRNICTDMEFRDVMIEYLNKNKDHLKGIGFNLEGFNLVSTTSLQVKDSIFDKALSIYVYFKAHMLFKAADLSLSMNIEAIRGEMGAFDSRLHSLARPYVSQIETAENTVRLLCGSDMTTESGRLDYGYDKSSRCQDAISYRAAPQTHGGVRDTLKFLGRHIEAALENRTGYTYKLRYALDFLMIGLADLGNITERRAFRLTDEKLSYGLPTNLVYENPGENHGFPVIQAVGTAVLGELKTLSLPSKLSGMEKLDKQLSVVCGIRALEGVELLSKVIAVEMYMSAQAMDLVHKKMPCKNFGVGTQIAHDAIRNDIKVVKENRFVISDLLRMDEMIFSGALIQTLEKKIGQLN